MINGQKKAFMRAFAAAITLALLPVFAFAQDATELYRQWESIHSSVMTEGAAVGFLIPLVGTLQGANGTFFRSELTLVNNKSRTQTIVVP